MEKANEQAQGEPSGLKECSGCRFWEERGTRYRVPYGVCRRRPPVISDRLIPNDSENDWGDDDIMRASVQPMTEKGDWCGEFVRYVETEDPQTPEVPDTRGNYEFHTGNAGPCASAHRA